MLTVIAHKRTSDKIDSDACRDRADETMLYKMFVSRHKKNFYILWSSGINPLRRGGSLMERISMYTHACFKGIPQERPNFQALCYLYPLDDSAL